MLVKEWLPRALAKHQERHPDSWPDPDGEEGSRLFREWLKAFIEEKVKQCEFEAASRQINGNGIEHTSFHLPTMLGCIRANRAAATPTAPAHAHAERTAAEAASRGCPHCGGLGLAAVYHPEYAGRPTLETTTSDGRPRVVAARVAAHCVCDAGKWIRARTEPETLGRIPDFADAMAGRTRWLAYNPTEVT